MVAHSQKGNQTFRRSRGGQTLFFLEKTNPATGTAEMNLSFGMKSQTGSSLARRLQDAHECVNLLGTRSEGKGIGYGHNTTSSENARCNRIIRCGSLDAQPRWQLLSEYLDSAPR